ETVLGPQPDGGSREGVVDGPEVGEGGQHRDLDGGGDDRRPDRPGELHTLGHRGVHLPVARHKRGAAHVGARGSGAQPSRSRRTATPGSRRPSRNSRVAPPPVLTWVILSDSPAASIAAAASPPPTTLTASESARARATPRVPRANSSIS